MGTYSGSNTTLNLFYMLQHNDFKTEIKCTPNSNYKKTESQEIKTYLLILSKLRNLKSVFLPVVVY